MGLRLANSLLKVRKEPVRDEGLQTDVHIAAVWLGKPAYVERLVAEGVRFLQPKDEDGFDNRGKYTNKSGSIFKHLIHAATIRGDVKMVKIILGALEKPQGNDEDKTYATNVYWGMLRDTVIRRRREVFEFLLENEAYSPYYNAIELRLYSIPWPDMFERAAAMVERHSGRPVKIHLDRVWKAAYRYRNSAETLGYFLSKAEDGSLDRSESEQRVLQPLLSRALLDRNEATVRVLLEGAGADPNYTDSALDTPLLDDAVCGGRISTVGLLLDHGADPNVGDPVPIVRAAIKERPDIFRLLRERGARLDTLRTGGHGYEGGQRAGTDFHAGPA
ncbi:uncharacterized protein PG986_012229 [Apiospora aurea]|uniref:Ankyrin repeat protein n=1 Tax=Apiospora aurea TaxID=335848 RepID=A0ABR1Q0J6_9PEZI